MTRLFARAAALAASAFFCPQLLAAQIAFGAFGDIPYNRDEEPALPAIIAEMNREKLAFAIHVGDFKDARSECSDELFRERRETFGLSHHPFFYTPGDNEWVDCRRARWAPREPLERLEKLREIFFASDSSHTPPRLPSKPFTTPSRECPPSRGPTIHRRGFKRLFPTIFNTTWR